MQVLQIITEERREVRNARELARAFSDSEWRRILNYFVRTKNVFNGSLGDDRGEIEGRMVRFNRLVGSDISERLTTVYWIRNAARYGMNVNINSPSWQQIYDHLYPWREEPEPENYDVAGTGSGTGTGTNNTPEQSFEISNWVEDEYRPPNDIFTSEEQIFRYVNRFWYLTVVSCGQDGNTECKRNLDFALFMAARQDPEGPNNDTNPRIAQPFYTMRTIKRETLPALLNQDTPLTKSVVDSYLFAWLTQADSLVAANRRNQ